MEAADHHRHAGGAQRPREVERARKLVRLHADEADHAEAVMPTEPRDDRLRLMRALVSSIAVMSISTSGPSASRRAASCASV